MRSIDDLWTSRTARRKMHHATVRCDTDFGRLSHDAGRRDELDGGRRPRGSGAPASSEIHGKP